MVGIEEQVDIFLRLNDLYTEQRFAAQWVERAHKSLTDISLQFCLRTLAADHGNRHRQVAPLAHFTIFTNDKAGMQFGKRIDQLLRGIDNPLPCHRQGDK